MKKNALLYYFIFFIVIAFLFISCKENRLPAHVTYTEHIAPILNKNCVSCHRQGGTSHIYLSNYNQVKNYAGSIVYTIKEKLMPPWPADPNYTEFIGQRILSEREINLILKWSDQGAKEGPLDKLQPVAIADSLNPLPKPDLQIPVQPIFLNANSVDKFLLVKVPFNFPNDTFASLIEFVPGKKNIVHHVNGDMVKFNSNQKKDVFTGALVVNMEEDTVHLLQAFEQLGLKNDDGTWPALQKSVVNYLPGAFGQKYPDGIGGYVLPAKGAFLLNDLHYGYTGKEDIWDSSYINIYFTHTPPLRPVLEFQLGTLGVAPVEPDMKIQPNTVKNVYSKFTVPFDISILTINPHMHLLGRSFKAYALKPEGDTIRLISIPKWNFSWQYFYTFKTMVKIPKGSTIIAEGVYDNTDKNLNNPFNPPRLITDQAGSMKATDEMFQFIITYLPYQAGDEKISLDGR